MTFVVKFSLLLMLLRLDLTFATFNFGNSIVIIEDNQGVFVCM